MEFYRYHDYHSGDKCIIELFVFEPVKETKCGYWIKQKGWSFGKKRWISKTSKKRYAYPTKAEAAYSFLRRKQMQKMYVDRSAKRVKRAEYMAMDLVKETDPIKMPREREWLKKL